MTFKVGDMVIVHGVPSFASSYFGGYKDYDKGVVLRVDNDGDVEVNFHDGRYAFIVHVSELKLYNPSKLEKAMK